MSGESGPTRLCRRHKIAPRLLYHWKKQYSRGKFNNEPAEEWSLRDRVEKLERLVGKLVLENDANMRPARTW
ncbi:MAG: transposase [Dehalococcoidia bacterium]|nr:transposase [Dehalococcoidia bacterium]